LILLFQNDFTKQNAPKEDIVLKDENWNLVNERWEDSFRFKNYVINYRILYISFLVNILTV
jgi:hypothetical protein